MSESPIQLRGKSGGVVFDGTQSPGGGSQPGAMRMLGPFTLGPDDFVGPDGFGFMAALIYTPTAGDAISGFAWLLRELFTGSINDGTFSIAPQTTPDTGTAGPVMTPNIEINLVAFGQSQGAGNTGGDYFAGFLLPALVSTVSGAPEAPSQAGPLISDGTPLYLNGEVSAFDPGGSIDFYVYVATPAAP